jgi:hypothetical protein
MDFLYCYRILGLDTECDWDTARHRYQQLVSRHHPDRPAALDDGHRLTEINRAWRQLRHYYQQHGRMPLQNEYGASPPLPITPFTPMPAAPRRRRSIWLLLTGLGVVLVLLSGRDPPLPLPEQSIYRSTPAASAATPQTTGASIYYGDSLGHVAETLGPPHDTREGRWYYGGSWIDFRDGRVSDWHSSADYPLPTHTLGHTDLSR